MMIHKACCYLVLFFNTAPSLLFTPVITFYCIYKLLCVLSTPAQGYGTLCYVPGGGMTSVRV